jgi:hypothetical protein
MPGRKDRLSKPWRRASYRAPAGLWGHISLPLPLNLLFPTSFPVSPEQVRRPQTLRLSPLRRPRCLGCLGTMTIGISS